VTPAQIATELGLRLVTGTPARSAALHEAGHVVVARAHGVHVDRACAVRIGQTAGHTSWTAPRDLAPNARIAILLGGVAAETIAWRAPICSAGCSSDLSRAWGLIARASMLAAILSDTRALLARRWSTVLAVAEEMDELGCIGRREIAALTIEED
jgi:Peptidase family M41